MKFAYLIEPPFNYLDETGTITGSDIELARHVFCQLDINDVEFVEAKFADLLPGLARREWHMTTGLFATTVRRKSALFSRAIWALPDGLLIRSENAQRINGYCSIAQDDALTLAVINGQAQYQTAKDAGMHPDRIAFFGTYIEAAQAVQEGRVSAYASVARAHEGYLQEYDASDLTSVVVPTSEKAPAFGCFGFAITDTNFKARVDGVLNAFIGSDDHRQLLREFGFSDEDVDRLL